MNNSLEQIMIVLTILIGILILSYLGLPSHIKVALKENIKSKLPKLSPFALYFISIILIVLFPPMNRNFGLNPGRFDGWDFIYYLGNGFEINVIYILLEIGIVTLVYFAYFLSNKKWKN